MTPRRVLLALALVPGCVSVREAAPALDQPPPEPPAVLAEVAPPPVTAPEPTPEPPPAPPADLAVAARDAGDLTTFLSLVTEAGLQDSLTGPGPRTVFAPSDAAFAGLPKGELERVRRNKKKLAALLGHHVVAGATLTATDLAARPPDAAPLRTLAGTDLAAPTQLERTDLTAANGVLHVLPLVLQPGKPAKPGAPTTAPTDSSPAPTPAKSPSLTLPPKPTLEPATKSDKPATPPADKSPSPKSDKSSDKPATPPADKSPTPKSDKPATPPADKSPPKSDKPATPPADKSPTKPDKPAADKSPPKSDKPATPPGK